MIYSTKYRTQILHRFTLGEPSGEKTERIQALAGTLISAGLRAPIRRIRDEIWMKLWGNLCFNPISARMRPALMSIPASARKPESTQAWWPGVYPPKFGCQILQ